MPGATTELRRSLDHAGYYPELVGDVLDVALAGEDVLGHLVHPETTFDTEVRRHVTVLVLTASRLVLAHVDDHPADADNPAPSASATTESVPLRHLHTVALTHVVPVPERHTPGDVPAELTLALGWGAVRRIDLEPATCGDPECDADHGLTGTSSPDDVVVRVSAQAEGAEAVRAAVDFARTLSAATARAR
ncbi:MAG: phosphodiesterase [Cellulomonadaceae bacterium]|nr:phosphodiesterase [Cellulomonadaceae bacterium]